MSVIGFSVILWFGLSGMLLISQCNGDPVASESKKQSESHERFKRGGGLSAELFSAYQSALVGTHEVTTQSPWMSYAPPAPNPSDVECSVTVPTVRVHNGICTRLADGTPICQAGIHMSFYGNGCHAIIRRRYGGTVGAGNR